MIVIELQLRDLFATIPVYDITPGNPSLPLTYSFGTHKTLLHELRQRHKNNSSLYPLIWLMMPFKESQSYDAARSRDLTLILAVNTQKNPLNPERYELTFRRYLIPNLELIKQALTLANNIRLLPLSTLEGEDQFWDVIKFPNYGNPASFDGNTENFATDYWDAIQITFRGRFTQNCLNVNSNQYNTEIITQWQY